MFFLQSNDRTLIRKLDMPLLVVADALGIRHQVIDAARTELMGHRLGFHFVIDHDCLRG
jgi:hypothetical protein